MNVVKYDSMESLVQQQHEGTQYKSIILKLSINSEHALFVVSETEIVELEGNFEFIKYYGDKITYFTRRELQLTQHTKHNDFFWEHRILWEIISLEKELSILYKKDEKSFDLICTNGQL